MDYYSRRIIEALRSGISSREVGQCFSSARPKIMREIYDSLSAVAEDHHPRGMIITGKYGEGKTHLLNSVFNMAHEQNMVVSAVTLSKETPLSNLPALYQKILQGTFLPGQVQPGLSRALDSITSGSPFLPELAEFCLTGLETNRLYYVLKAYTATQDDDEKYALLGDLEGELLASGKLRQFYQRIYGTKATYKVSFTKTKNIMDYYAFISKLFLALGYSGWVLLFDEAELTGRLGKNARLKAYANIAKLLNPERMAASYCVFAFNASYVPDIIRAKNEELNLEQSLTLLPEDKAAVKDVLSRIETAPQLIPLDRTETLEIIGKIINYHAKAYGWEPEISPETLYSVTEKHGYLLRTRIRTAVSLLDQIYQYGEAGEIVVNELGQISFDEDEAV